MTFVPCKEIQKAIKATFIAFIQEFMRELLSPRTVAGMKQGILCHLGLCFMKSSFANRLSAVSVHQCLY